MLFQAWQLLTDVIIDTYFKIDSWLFLKQEGSCQIHNIHSYCKDK